MSGHDAQRTRMLMGGTRGQAPARCQDSLGWDLWHTRPVIRLDPLPALLPALLACATLAGCGARSTLLDELSAGSGGGVGAGGTGGAGGTAGTGGAPTSSSSTGPLCLSDEECDDGVGCTRDRCGELGCEHLADDAVCSDGQFCTLDACDVSLGCVSQPSPDLCDDGLSCTLDACDESTDSCLHDPCDSLCDDQIFCDGIERCDAALGCVDGPPACTLGLGCEQSACAETSDTCSHTLPPGCAAPDVHLLVADSGGNLHDVAPYQGTETLIAPSNGNVHLDVAVLNGRWFVVAGDLVELAPGTNQVIAVLGQLFANALGGGPDGKLYAAYDIVYRIDPDSGAQEFVAALPEGHTSSGDIAFIGDRLFVSTDSGCGGSLVEVDVASGTAAVLGGDGLGCVYGLAPGGDRLFVVNCDGKIGTFDPATGEARVLWTTSIQTYGADRLP